MFRLDPEWYYSQVSVLSAEVSVLTFLLTKNALNSFKQGSWGAVTGFRRSSEPRLLAVDGVWTWSQKSLRAKEQRVLDVYQYDCLPGGQGKVTPALWTFSSGMFLSPVSVNEKMVFPNVFTILTPCCWGNWVWEGWNSELTPCHSSWPPLCTRMFNNVIVKADSLTRL